jgi:hypothetical protein
MAIAGFVLFKLKISLSLCIAQTKSRFSISVVSSGMGVNIDSNIRISNPISLITG